MVVPVLILAACFLGLFLLMHPGIIPFPGPTVLPPAEEQPVTTTTPATGKYDEIRARYGDRYEGYEDLIRRTGSGGFDTRDADAARAGLTPAAVTGAPTATGSPEGTTTASPATASAGVEAYIVHYTNEERRLNGVPALEVSTCLSGIARSHSEDMAANQYFSHEDPGGQDPTARAESHGCPTVKPMGGGRVMTGIAENIGKMPTGNVAGHGYVQDTPQAVARAQVDSWMASPGHRGNILNPAYTLIGAGTARDAAGSYLSTQDFW